jgi:hypothetical protein
MKKVKLLMEGLKVETFEVDEEAKDRRGTVRGNAETLLRSCQTEQYDCTVQGGYTCDYGSCVYTGCGVCQTSEGETICAW